MEFCRIRNRMWTRTNLVEFVEMYVFRCKILGAEKSPLTRLGSDSYRIRGTDRGMRQI